MAKDPDFRLLFGVDGGVSIDQGSGEEIFNTLKKIVKNINDKDALKVKVGLDDKSAEEFKKQIKGVMSGSDAGVEVKVTGLDKTASDAGKAAKALDSVASSAKKAGSIEAVAYKDAVRAVNEYYAALKQLANSKSDVVLSGSYYKSESGEYNELANALNRTKTAYDLVANAKNVLSDEHQAQIQALITKRTNEYNLALEQRANKELEVARATTESAEASTRLAQVNAELKEIAVQNGTLTTQYRKITSQGSIDGVDMTQVDALKVKYQDLLRQTELLKANRKTATDEDIAGVRQLQAEVLRLTTTINGQAEAAKRASAGEKDSKKEQMASLREVIALYDRIDKYLLKNSNAIGTEQYSSLKNIRDNLYGIVQAGDEAGDGMTKMSKTDFKNLNGQVSSLQSSLKDAGCEGNTFAKTIVAAYQKFGGWMLVTQSLTKVVSGLRQMVENVKQIDAAMTELKKVTNETAATYDSFLIKAQARAAQLGATVADVVTATADFSKLGHNLEDATALADAALVYKNVGDGIEDISTASQSIISTMQAFGYEADQAMLIVDKFNQIGNRFAIDSAGLGEAMVRSAAAMASANNTLDETIALATAANTILQNPETVGTTLKTLSMYLRAAKTEAEEAGESTEGMANSVSELRGEILSLTGGAVDIQSGPDAFKSSYQILKELSQVWDQLTDISQANILEMIGGRRLPRCTVMCILNASNCR